MKEAGYVLEFSHEKLRRKVKVFLKKKLPVLKKTQVFKTLLWLNRNWDCWSSKGNWKMVYPGVPLPMKIINIQLNENYNRDQGLLYLNSCAVKRTKQFKQPVRNVISEKRG